MSIFRVLHAEMLKLKRTLAFRVIFVLPLLVSLLQFFVFWRTKKFGAGFHLWETLPTNMLGIWAVFMMPLLITLETALLGGIEHSDKQWKHIFALPIPRHTVYLAKFVVAQALIAISTLFLCVLTVFIGLAVMRLRPELAHSGPVPYGWLAKYAAFVWLASWLIIAIHTWVSTRWSGFAVALGTGIGGTFFALFAASASLGKYYPWLLPMNVFTGERFAAALLIGAVGGAIAALLGCLEFVRRDVA
jgi:lantibiotic transport system permease protein